MAMTMRTGSNYTANLPSPAASMTSFTSSQSDTGNDVMNDIKLAACTGLNGQWVTLSKSLLLQLVERICRLSFQPDMTDVVTHHNWKSTEDIGTEPAAAEAADYPRRPASLPTGSTCNTATLRTGSPEVIERSRASVGNSITTATAGAHNDVSALNDDGKDDASATDDVTDNTSGCDGDKAKASVDYDCVTSKLGARNESVDADTRSTFLGRRFEAAKRLRQRARRRRRRRNTQTSRRDLHSLSPRVTRHRQSWMALSKELVYVAIENQLRQVSDSEEVAATPCQPQKVTTKKPAAIWNPAISVSPLEQRLMRASRAELDCARALTSIWRRDVHAQSTGYGVTQHSSTKRCDANDCGGTSMLSELLGFGLDAAQHTSSQSSESFGASERVCRRAPTRIWRPVDAVCTSSSTLTCCQSRARSRPRWVAVNKGDVCSLVDNLVTTMIVASSSSDDVSPVAMTARCSAASATEPRKWKSDLLQRMRRNEEQLE